MKIVPTKTAFDKFKPESVVFVISYDSKMDRPSGMVAGFNMKCSTDPYRFAVSLWKQGYTHKLIQQSKEFVIAVPNKELEPAISIFGNYHGDKIDKFKRTKIDTLPAQKVKSPLLKDATINLECKLYKQIDVGDHIVFIGTVVAAHINKEKKVLLNMGKKDGNRLFREF